MSEFFIIVVTRIHLGVLRYEKYTPNRNVSHGDNKIAISRVTDDSFR